MISNVDACRPRGAARPLVVDALEREWNDKLARLADAEEESRRRRTPATRSCETQRGLAMASGAATDHPETAVS